MTWNDIPDYIETEDSSLKYFLTLNKTLDGTWSAGYTAFDGECTQDERTALFADPIPHQRAYTIIGINSLTYNEIPTRMHFAIERYKRRNGFDDNETLYAPPFPE